MKTQHTDCHAHSLEYLGLTPQERHVHLHGHILSAMILTKVSFKEYEQRVS